MKVLLSCSRCICKLGDDPAVAKEGRSPLCLPFTVRAKDPQSDYVKPLLPFEDS